MPSRTNRCTPMKRNEQQELETLLSEAAKQLRDITKDADATDADRINAFKALNTYYNTRFGGKQKAPATPEDQPDGDMPTFGQLSESLGVGNGGARSKLRNS